MVVIATWPVLMWLQNHLWGKRWMAVVLMTLLLLLLFVLPIGMVITSLIGNAGPILDWAANARNWQMPQLEWLQTLPLIGARLYASWQGLMSEGVLVTKIQPYIGQDHLVYYPGGPRRRLLPALLSDAVVQRPAV